MEKIIGFLFLTIIIACNNNKDSLVGHQLKSEGDRLHISYSGEGDVVQFKMFEGLFQVLEKNASGIFEGQLVVENLADAIFSYEIIVHKKDSLGKMIEIEYQPESGDEIHFLWVGKNRNLNFLKASELSGELTEKQINSGFLEETRDLTIYTPKEFNESTPIIYFTDGQVVKTYAQYIDKLISEERISPIKLVGVHSSDINRYEEYVINGVENELFGKHQDFFYKEVMNNIERETPNWKGKSFIYGFSNGGAFCMHAGINHPKLFEEIIAFSTADYITEFLRPIEFNFENYPKFYTGAGRYEERIFRENIKFVQKLKGKNIQVEFKEFISGHDYNVWKFEFLIYLEKRFAK